MKENWPYIALAVSVSGSLLIAIFRNQLSKVGDNISSNFDKILKVALQIARFSVLYLMPIGLIIFNFIRPLSKESLAMIIFTTALFILNLAFQADRIIKKSIKEEISALRDELVNERKMSIERDKALLEIVQNLSKLGRMQSSQDKNMDEIADFAVDIVAEISKFKNQLKQ